MQNLMVSGGRIMETCGQAASGAAASPLSARSRFESSLLRFINQVLPEIHEPLKVSPRVERGTPLFESGLIDSLAILHLIGFVEKATGRPVPSRKVVMKYFRSVEAISQAFWTDEKEA